MPTKKDKPKKDRAKPKAAVSAVSVETAPQTRANEPSQASSEPPPIEPESPPTRRSTPRPPAGDGVEAFRVEPLGAVEVDEAGPETELEPSYDLDGESATEVAPVGPTEYKGRWDAGGPQSEATPKTASTASVEELEQQIHELEARLDKMIRQRGPVPAPPPSSSSAAPVPAPERPKAAEEPPRDGVLDTARELLSTDYYLRQWGRMGMRNRSEEVDEFGLDPKYESRWRPFFDFLHKVYFRVDTEGTQHIPDEGRCLIVANHSGGPLPYDGIMLRTTVRREHPKQRELRWLAEDFIYYLPFVGAIMNRIGAVRACQENAERLLAGGKAVAVFPEGAKGIGKLYKDRYRLQRFGRGGFIRLCLRTQTPIIPCAIIGAEEANPMLYRVEYMTKALGIPYLPVTPTFPALGPLGLLPAPTKWKVRFGERISFEGCGPEAADDEILVGRLAERVRATIQGMLDDALAERQSIWFG